MSEHKQIRMNDLKELFAGLGAEEVSTYIQSGNVVFRHAKLENHSGLGENG